MELFYGIYQNLNTKEQLYAHQESTQNNIHSTFTACANKQSSYRRAKMGTVAHVPISNSAVICDYKLSNYCSFE